MRIIEGFDFFPLTFDDRGQLESRQEFDLLTDRANAVPATDAIFIKPKNKQTEDYITGRFG